MISQQVHIPWFQHWPPTFRQIATGCLNLEITRDEQLTLIVMKAKAPAPVTIPQQIEMIVKVVSKRT